MAMGRVPLGGVLSRQGWGMSQPFNGGTDRSVETLPPEQRAQRYRDMADGAFLTAQRTDKPELKAEYLALAMSWHAIAQELEEDLGNLAQVEASLNRLRAAKDERQKR